MFGIAVPESVPGVPSEVLQPRGTWDDPKVYDEQAKKLAQMFIDNFKQFQDEVEPDVRAAGPRIAG